MLFAGCRLLVNSACSGHDQGVLTTVTLKKPTSKERIGKVVEIPYEKIASSLEGVEAFLVTNASGEEVPYQLEYRGEETPVNLLVQVDLPANGGRSEERRVGKEGVSTCRSRCSPCH